MKNHSKICSKCGVEKSEKDFYQNKSKGTINTECKLCSNLYGREKRKNDPEYRKRCVEISKSWRKRNPEKSKFLIRNATLKLKYGIGITEYEIILKNQKGRCAICGADNPKISGKGSKSLHIDHDHKTGKIRGLLCQPCNTSLGRFNDDPVLVLKAYNYLIRNG